MKKIISESALQAKIIQLANTINQIENHNETPVVFVWILKMSSMCSKNPASIFSIVDGSKG